MKNINYILIVVILILLSLLFLNKNSNRLIQPNNLIVEHCETKDIDYLYLLDKSIIGDNECLINLITLDFYNSFSYDHGVVLVDLLFLLGEEKFIESIEKLNKDERIKLKSYLNAGIIYNNKNYINGKNLTILFPKVDNFLNK